MMHLFFLISAAFSLKQGDLVKRRGSKELAAVAYNRDNMTGIYYFHSAQLTEVPTDNLISVDAVSHSLDAAIRKNGWPQGTRVKSEDGRTFRVEGFRNGKQLVRDMNMEEDYEVEVATLTPQRPAQSSEPASSSSVSQNSASASASSSMFSSSSTTFRPPPRESPHSPQSDQERYRQTAKEMNNKKQIFLNALEAQKEARSDVDRAARVTLEKRSAFVALKPEFERVKAEKEAAEAKEAELDAYYSYVADLRDGATKNMEIVADEFQEIKNKLGITETSSPDDSGNENSESSSSASSSSAERISQNEARPTQPVNGRPADDGKTLSLSAVANPKDIMLEYWQVGQLIYAIPFVNNEGLTQYHIFTDDELRYHYQHSMPHPYTKRPLPPPAKLLKRTLRA